MWRNGHRAKCIRINLHAFNFLLTADDKKQLQKLCRYFIICTKRIPAFFTGIRQRPGCAAMAAARWAYASADTAFPYCDIDDGDGVRVFPLQAFV